MNTEKYNGWSNWDTWEAFNIISNDENAYNHVKTYLEKSTTTETVKTIGVQIEIFYIKNKTPKTRRVDLDKVNFGEIIEHMFNWEELNHSFLKV